MKYFLIVLLIFVILLYFANMNVNAKGTMNKNIVEMNNTLENRALINKKYDTNLTEVSNVFNDKQLHYNHTQLYYIFLLQLFNALSVNRVNYDMELVEDYPKNTLDFNVRDRLDAIVKPLLKKIMETVKMVDFYVTGYESLKVYAVKNSNIRINKVDLFVYDRDGWVALRLLLEIAEIPKVLPPKGKLMTCAEYTTPEFPTYFIGYPAKNQFIPLPSQVVVSGRQVLNIGEEGGVDYPMPVPFERAWINSVEIINSNLTLGALEKFEGEQLPGMNNIPFDYTNWDKWNDGNTPYIIPARLRNQWPRIKSQPKDRKAWPCMPTNFVWNSMGIEPEAKPTKECPGVRTSLLQQPLTTSKYPDYFDKPRKIGEYSWLFNNIKKEIGLGSYF